ncbi:MAG: hypothetical protein ACLTGQ_15060 [Mediterraneibacter gnavus]
MNGKNEIMNITDYEVVDTRSNDIQISGTEVATQLVAVVPNAIAAPFQRYHEVEVKKEIALKTLEYRAKALEHRTMNRDKLCDTMVELAKNKALDKETFQMLMVAYESPNI